MKNFLFKKQLLVSTGILLLVSNTTPLYAKPKDLTSKKVKVKYIESDIILPDGRIVKEYMASGDGKIFIPYEIVEDITSQPVFWDRKSKTLNIGNVPIESIMSNKINIYNYTNPSGYKYSPKIATNQTMTMGGVTHEIGYSFTDISTVSFNLLGEYSTITGLLGCEDFKSSTGKVVFYLDNELLESCSLTSDQLPERITIDVTGGSQLKLVFRDFYNHSQINLADLYIK